MGGVGYVERLRVPPWWWLMFILFVLSLAVAVFAYLPAAVAGAITAALGGGAALLLIGYGRLELRVTPEAFTAGPNRLEGRWIADAEPLVGESARLALGPAADHRDFLHTRPYIPGAVRVRLADPVDPHPCWIVSSRRPEELAKAILEMKAVR